MTSHQGTGQKRKWPWILAAGVIVLVVAGSCGATNSTNSDARPPAGVAASTTPSFRSTDTGKYGQPLKAGDVTVIAATPKKSTSQYTGSQVCSTVSYQNGGDSPVTFNPFDWKFRTTEGVEASASIPFNAKSPLRSGNLAPGGKVSGAVCSDDTISSASAVVYSPGFGLVNELSWTA